ncbi:hypothetical protein LCGC14_2947450, partial [marine sediment metagenome]
MMLKPIEGYEGLYSVTPDGRVWSKPRHGTKGGWLKPYKDKDGYMIAPLRKNRKQKHEKIHRLVAQAYIPNPGNKPFINHLSGVKNDNRVEN